MHIETLRIENIRNLDEVELTNLSGQNVILITGPNGSGKSAFFEAIRIFKSSFASYAPRKGVNLQNQYPDLITEGAETAAITISFSLTEQEKQMLETDQDLLEGHVDIDSELRARVSGEHQQLLRRIFSQEFVSRVLLGKIDHIPSDRSFAQNDVSSINFSEEYIQNDLHRMVDDTSAKFQNLKNDLLWMHLVDLQAKEHDEDPPGYIDGIREIFTHFLDDVEFMGVELDTRMQYPPRFPVQTPRGVHEIDTLSSGQKEILMSYALLEKRKHTNSIILFDEPELHLNGAIERKVLGYIRRMASKGNQFFVATHSPEIIGSITTEYICRLSGGNPNTAEAVNLQSERIQLLKHLGATHHIQMISERIVFVEGESDEDILTYLSPNLPHHASFVVSEGVGKIRGVTSVLNRASQFENFRAIRDRDDLSDDKKCTYRGRVGAKNSRLEKT